MKVDPEFKALGITQTDEERSLLLASLLKDGCRDYLILWKGHGVIVDGHTREEMCHEHKIPYKTREMPFKDRSEVVNWIIDNQLGRRNVNEEQKSYLRGKRYLKEKQPHGGQVPAEKGPETVSDPSDTAERLAEKFGVSDRTIRNDAKFAEAVDTLAKNVGPEIKKEILSGDSELSKKDVLEAAAAPPKQQAKAVRAAKKPKPKKPRQPKTAADDGPRQRNGKQAGDGGVWKKWADLFGKLKRATDEINEKHPADKFVREVHTRLNMADNSITAWKAAAR